MDGCSPDRSERSARREETPLTTEYNRTVLSTCMVCDESLSGCAYVHSCPQSRLTPPTRVRAIVHIPGEDINAQNYPEDWSTRPGSSFKVLNAKTSYIIGTWAFFSLEQTGMIFFFKAPRNPRELRFLRNSKRQRGTHSPCTTIS